MAYFYIKYVKYDDIPEYEKLGWRLRDSSLPCHHCYYAKVMRWENEGEPIEPKNAKSVKSSEPA